MRLATGKLLATSTPGGEPHLNGEALFVLPLFYRRRRELNLLDDWLIKDHCRVVSILGLGGVGKSAIAILLVRRLAERFDRIIWRSLRDIPDVPSLLDHLLQVLSRYGCRCLSSSWKGI